MGVMEGRTAEEIGDKFRDMYMRESRFYGTALPPLTIAALIANWKVWPLIQAVNFKLVPMQYRVPFQSTCGIGWTLYLSLLNARYAPFELECLTCTDISDDAKLDATPRHEV